MDILGLGANTGIIIGIIAITELIKQFDVKKKFSKYYVLIPAILSILAAFITTSTSNWKEFIQNIFLYVGVSTYIYKSGKDLIFNKNETK